MPELNGIPVYKIKRTKNGQASLELALVDYPAIEKNWVALKNTKAPLKFSTEADKQMLYGPILIPGFPIYRFDEKTKQEFYVVFTADEIQEIVREFQQEKIKLNYQHDSSSKINDAIVQEIWLSGNPDKSQSLGFNEPIGTAFVGVHIQDKTFWDKDIKSGNLKGFSIERFFNLELKKMEKFITAKTDKGIEIYSPSEKFVVNAEVTTKDDAGKDIPLSDGEYTLENGVKLICAAGKITDVVEVEEEMTPEEAGALEKIFSKVLKPLSDQITKLQTEQTELKTKLDKVTAAKPVTGNEDQPELKKKPTTQSTFENFRKLLNKN